MENIKGTEILSMLCHEAWHSYEFALRDAYNAAGELKNLKLYQEAKEYDYVLDNYISLEEDRERYANQKVEVDSREYADKTSKEYFEIIEDYNKQ